MRPRRCSACGKPRPVALPYAATPIPPDAEWDLDDDDTGAAARQVLNALGITPAAASAMTDAQFAKTTGLKLACRARIWARLERLRRAAAAQLSEITNTGA